MIETTVEAQTLVNLLNKTFPGTESAVNLQTNQVRIATADDPTDHLRIRDALSSHAGVILVPSGLIVAESTSSGTSFNNPAHSGKYYLMGKLADFTPEVVSAIHMMEPVPADAPLSYSGLGPAIVQKFTEKPAQPGMKS